MNSNVFRRFNEPKRKRILDNVSQKRSAEEAEESAAMKKLPEVYMVNKQKWYSTATAKELQSLSSMILLEDNDSQQSREAKHRIIQHKVR